VSFGVEEDSRMNSKTTSIRLDAHGNELEGGAATVIYQSPNGNQIEDWGTSEAKGHEGHKRYAIVRKDGSIIAVTPRGLVAAKEMLRQLEENGAIDATTNWNEFS